MPCIHLTSVDDPRLQRYCNLKLARTTSWQPQFVVEGEKLVVRLLECGLAVQSFLLMEKTVERMLPLLPPDVPAYVLPNELMAQLVGFDFHRGVMACVPRPAERELGMWLLHPSKPTTGLVCAEVKDPQNLGSILRIASGFGASWVLLGPNCCDPWNRRVLRVSMGESFRLPIMISQNLQNDLRRLRDEFSIELAATVLDPTAEPLVAAGRSHHFALVLGSEGYGLSADIVQLCSRRLTIPMQLGTDSLNVAVAAGIFLYHFTQCVPIAPPSRTN